MAVNKILHFSRQSALQALRSCILLAAMTCSLAGFAKSDTVDIVYACVDPSKLLEHASKRDAIARCLNWESEPGIGLCEGHYKDRRGHSVSHETQAKDVVKAHANEVALTRDGRSKLSGDVEVTYADSMLSAETAYIHHDAKNNQITDIELLGHVAYSEPGRLMRARRVHLSPASKTGEIFDVLYRFEQPRKKRMLPAYGRADEARRLPNRDIFLKGATYTTCSPKDNAWLLRAKTIDLYDAEGRGVARDAVLEVRDQPVLYAPYLTFPTSKERKTGFLLPTSGYSNIGGVDLSFPYYWNIAPNYDATIVPHVYSRRGLMIGGDTRFMTENTKGVLGGNFLPKDRAFGNYIAVHEISYPELRNLSTNRWSLFLRETTDLTDRLKLNVNYQKLSDDYFLQDFNNNMTVMTESQLLQEASLTYNGTNWFARGLVQSYQTLNPINQSPVDYIYQRLPQIQVRGEYDDLPLNLNFWVRAQYDLFHWPVSDPTQLEGPRYHVNPALYFDFRKPWGYLKPEVQLVENHYNLHTANSAYSPTFNHTIPRYSADAGLIFERKASWMREGFTQTFEPRLYYLYVPYQGQSNIPAFDSAYMIFRYEQLFRNNRFSGFDRISDGNQLAYAFRSRLLTDDDGKEKASFSIGQLRYFSDRQVQLCYAIDGQCEDNSRMLGFTSPTATYSPVTTVFSYNVSPALKLDASWAFDPALSATNNANFNFKYEPEENHIVKLIYTYLVAANIIELTDGVETLGAEHQLTFAYAWPFNDKWSSVGIYSYNISERYDMVSFLGIQYESCCWAFRAFAGRAFNSLNLNRVGSQYNNSVYVQLLLKGLGTVSSNDPASTIRTYLPTYSDLFHHS